MKSYGLEGHDAGVRFRRPTPQCSPVHRLAFVSLRDGTNWLQLPFITAPNDSTFNDLLTVAAVQWDGAVYLNASYPWAFVF